MKYRQSVPLTVVLEVLLNTINELQNFYKNMGNSECASSTLLHEDLKKVEMLDIFSRSRF